MMSNNKPWPFPPTKPLAASAPENTAKHGPRHAADRKQRKTVTQAERAQMQQLYKEGTPIEHIALQMDRAPGVIRRHLKAYKEAVMQQPTDAAQPAPAIQMYENPQQDSWEWFVNAHPGVVIRIEAFIGNDEMFWLVDAFLRGYMLGVGLSLDSRDSILANFHQNYWSKS